ncbi:MAG: hypothetical protein J6Q39_08275 [Bacteroidales bacterium]|nr:hypothetical protein [Bacteroidales bacterium]
MNRRQKLVQQRFLNNEEAVIAELERTYSQALADVNARVRKLQFDIEGIQGQIDVWDELGGDEAEKERLQSMLRSKVYQKQHQEAIQGQLDDVLDNLHQNSYKTIESYLKGCYDDGFIGTLYDLQGQGVPLIMPMDQESIVRAVQLDSKISGGLYSRMGEDVAGLKKVIASEVTRGIATGMTYDQVAKQISYKMTGTNYRSGGALARAKTIARTEGHRIQVQAGMDACYRARDMGADVLKQWDATLDDVTRESHQKVDGEVRELDEKFSNGLMFPGDPAGGAAEVVNCRCSLLQRARWALDEDELQTLKDRAEYFGLDKTEDFEDFQKKYLHSVKTDEMHQFGAEAKPPMEYDGVFDDFAELSLSRCEAEALSSLWSATQETGFEHGVVIHNGVVSKLVTSGLPDAVKIPVDGYESGLTVLHSHTNATPLSTTDFHRLLDGRVDKIGVIGYNSDVYMAYVGSGEIPSVEEFDMMAESIGRAVNYEIIEHPNFFDWTIEERNYMAIREQAYRIAQNYGWTLEGGRIDVK